MTPEQALPIALEFLGDKLPEQLRWQPNQKCERGYSITKLDACPACGLKPVEWLAGIFVGQSYLTAPHDRAIPPLTDALAMAMLRALCPQGKTSLLSAFEFDLIQARVIGGTDVAESILLTVVERAQNERRLPMK